MSTTPTLTIDGQTVEIASERNLLEMARKAGINIPTFCYHSDLSVYGACRLCLVEVHGRGIVASCSTAPEKDMIVKTHTKEIREMRKINIELLLANHDRECPTCDRNYNCTLQKLARQLGVTEVRFKSRTEMKPIDCSSPSLQRDPNKCVLCGDCVRICEEIQSVGAIEFAHRGAKSCVGTAFDKDLNLVECVNCGQCIAVCPTGALIPKHDREDVWKELHHPDKFVVAQIAPAVRVAIGEYFHLPPGTDVTGLIVAALRRMGFDLVFDTCFSADMTIVEEATELLERLHHGTRIPMFTSCCPGWVKFMEMYYPQMLHHLSSCKSPQQMFGALMRKLIPAEYKIDPKKIVSVSIMPCTAKKYEAKLDKFKTDGKADVEYVLTTHELARMISSMGIDFANIEPESLDMPMGFYTGAGVIFGVTGGVMEAALRYAAEKIRGQKLRRLEFNEVRGNPGIKEAEYQIGDVKLKVAVAHGLRNARTIVRWIKNKQKDYHFIEIMSCPGGCVCGGGQPVLDKTTAHYKQARTKGLYESDRKLPLHNSTDNYLVEKCYEMYMDKPGGHIAHEMLHTEYENRTDLLKA